MKITKLGHCCLLIEEKGKRILTDPGNYSTAQDEEKDIDVIMITHEHPDHLHVESLQRVLKNSPHAKIVTNDGVGKILKEKGIPYTKLSDGMKAEIASIHLEAHGKDHAVIYPTFPSVENTGYFISERLFYPGDAFTLPEKKVEILALPVAGPWMKLSEAIDYAKEIKPKVAFPVHDGMLQKDRLGPVHKVPKMMLEKEGIEFVEMKEGETKEF